MGTHKIQEIQLLRSLAVSLVLVFHFTSSFPLGFLGVDMFFVISGYVVTLSALRDNRQRPFTLWKFLNKRIRRLWPSFALFFVVTSILTVLLISPNEGSQQNAVKLQLASLFSLTNVIAPRLEGSYFGATSKDNPFLHTWSLSAEEQIFLIFGLFFLITFRFSHRIKNRFKRPLFFIMLVIVTSVSIFSFSLETPISFTSIFSDPYMSPFYRLYQFTLGAILASLHSYGIEKLRRPYLFMAVISATILLSLGFTPSRANYFINGLAASLMTTLLLHINLGRENNWSPKNLVTKFFLWKGDSSYEIYLWHWPVLVFSKIILTDYTFLSYLGIYTLTLILSALTKQITSRFFGKLQNKYWLTSFIGINTAFISLSIFAGYGSQIGWNQDWALGKHEIIRRDCHLGKIDEVCSWNSSQHKEFAFVVGDSMSWAIGNALIDLNHTFGMKTFARTRNNCSIGYPSLNNSIECNRWRKLVTDEILAREPKYVAIANSDGYSVIEKEGTKKFIATMLDKNIPVLYITVPPGGDLFSAKKSLLVKGPVNRYIARESSRVDIPNFDSNLFYYFNTSDFLCKPLCIVAFRGVEFYNYGAHLSVSGASYLSPFLATRIAELIKG